MGHSWQIHYEWYMWCSLIPGTPCMVYLPTLYRVVQGVNVGKYHYFWDQSPIIFSTPKFLYAILGVGSTRNQPLRACTYLPKKTNKFKYPGMKICVSNHLGFIFHTWKKRIPGATESSWNKLRSFILFFRCCINFTSPGGIPVTFSPPFKTTKQNVHQKDRDPRHDHVHPKILNHHWHPERLDFRSPAKHFSSYGVPSLKPNKNGWIWHPGTKRNHGKAPKLKGVQDDILDLVHELPSQRWITKLISLCAMILINAYLFIKSSL